MGKTISENKMDKIQIKATIRDLKKDKTKNLKVKGLLPAELYGHNVQNLHLTLNSGDFEKAFKKAGESTIVEILTDDGKTHPALIQDVQLHYLTSKPIHADFYQISMTEKLKAKVPLEFSGTSAAIKNLGGTLVRILTEVEVECLPTDLPHNIEIDISSLNTFQDTIHIRDLKISDKVKITLSPEDIVAKVQAPRNVEEDLAAAPDEKAAVEAAVAASEKPKAEETEKAEEKTK